MPGYIEAADADAPSGGKSPAEAVDYSHGTGYRSVGFSEIIRNAAYRIRGNLQWSVVVANPEIQHESVKISRADQSDLFKYGNRPGPIAIIEYQCDGAEGFISLPGIFQLQPPSVKP
jgi:hypothetical protein